MQTKQIKTYYLDIVFVFAHLNRWDGDYRIEHLIAVIFISQLIMKFGD